jgi:branched-chain amino acid transport system permease protein
MRPARNRLLWISGALLVLAALAVLPRTLSPYYLHLVNVALVYVVMIVGLNFVLGWTGLISLAHAGFMGIGAYTSALLTVDHRWSFWLALPVAGIAAVLFSVVVGVPTVRLKGHYFAMATLGLGEIVRMVLQNWKAVTHGADGVVGIPGPALGPFSFAREPAYFYLLLVAAGSLVFLAGRIRRSTYGRAMLAVRQAELAADAMGVDVARTKLLAFALSAFYAGIAGSLYAHLFQFISPDVFGLPLTVIAYAGLVTGGAGHIMGATFGAVFITFLPEWLRFLERVYLVVYGTGILLVLVLMPYGIVPLGRRLWADRRWSPVASGPILSARRAP